MAGSNCRTWMKTRKAGCVGTSSTAAARRCLALTARRDQGFDVFDAPGRYPGPELHRLWEAARLNPGPPGGLANRNGTAWRKNAAQPDKAGSALRGRRPSSHEGL